MCKRIKYDNTICVGSGGDIDQYRLEVDDLGVMGTRIKVYIGDESVTIRKDWKISADVFIRRLTIP